MVKAATALAGDHVRLAGLLGRADVYMQVICADNETLWSIVSPPADPAGRASRPRRMLEMQVHNSAYRDLAARDAA